jgi:hypothetical protein
MKFTVGLFIGFCLGWMLASQYPGGVDEIVTHLRAGVQNSMPWTH